ncbi:glycosyl hydrolase family 28 protein [Terrimonas sp. NA20]|uniref:Glycosyl hydrolase family 28 protein n=1 Tax=Terrimonas ginsenosidimutans TaxID=2908004 RepID=A0ABS9KM56_9BACT|nr:glycosyl hydrolase family 28 protein [Terrimonas ginsenosidimutans]MCG2613399.1 glycosyl hydrolase family 28 protein [Terrimonas ginsenosidimutans]
MISPMIRSVFFSIVLLQLSCGSIQQSSKQGYAPSAPDRNQVGAHALPADIAPVKAPFPVKDFKKPLFPALTITVRAASSSNGKHTTAIQSAIDEVSQRNGGTVIIPKGEWYSGRIHLKSNVNLHLEDGAVIYFSGEVEDYRPAVFTRFEGVEVMSLGACIYANGQQHIAITGKGKLVGPAKGGSISRQARDTIVTEDLVPHTKPVADRVFEGYGNDFVFRPMFISPINCKDVYIEGITLEKTAFWNIVPAYCDGVIIRGVTVNSVGIPRGDGIDIESSRNVLIEYCTLNCGDDCFTIKAGRAEDGKRVNIPSENIVIRHCLA